MDIRKGGHLIVSNNKQEKRAKDFKIGESVTGYIAKFFKAPKSLTPDVENVVLVTKGGEELTIWAAGDISYLRERMSRAGVGEGVLCKITRTNPREDRKANSKQKYFFDILFNKADTKSVEELSTALTSTRAPKTDNEGFSEY